MLKLNKKTILASASPRRSELLKSLDIDFEVFPSKIKEVYSDDMPIEDIPCYLAKKKAQSLIHTFATNNCLIIAADTIVVCQNKIYGKPRSNIEAKQFLTNLSNKTHRVITGVCLMAYEDASYVFSDTTEVSFKKLKETEIDYYISTSNPLDKAGAYGIQDWIGKIGVQSIKGCYFNVMGLPLPILYKFLSKFT